MPENHLKYLNIFFEWYKVNTCYYLENWRRTIFKKCSKVNEHHLVGGTKSWENLFAPPFYSSSTNHNVLLMEKEFSALFYCSFLAEMLENVKKLSISHYLVYLTNRKNTINTEYSCFFKFLFCVWFSQDFPLFFSVSCHFINWDSNLIDRKKN